MANPTVSFRVPQHIIKQVEKTAQITGKSKTKLFLEGLELALSKSSSLTDSPTTSATLKGLQQQIEYLLEQSASHATQLAALRGGSISDDDFLHHDFEVQEGLFYQGAPLAPRPVNTKV